MKTYFVSFNYSFNENGEYRHGFGNMSVEREKPFTHIDQLNEVGEKVAKHQGYPKGSVVIISYQLLET